MGFYLGFDFGTSSIKAAAINENGILQKTAIISVSMVSLDRLFRLFQSVA